MLILPILTVLSATPIALPPAPPVVMDYLVVDDAHRRVWVPAGNTGRVDVIDIVTSKVTPIEGFLTAPSQRPGRPPMGPSSATVGPGVVFVGNRADKSVCAFDAQTLKKSHCVTLGSMPDGLAWVGPGELWVTTPRDHSITVVTPTVSAAPITIAVDGSPEGYAVDAERGRFYTNLEDHDATLAIDVRTHKVVARYAAGCGGDGPRGLAVDTAHQWLVVACSDGAAVLDIAHGGKSLGRIKTGAGVDNIAYWSAQRIVYIASGATGQLTLAHVDDHGALAEVATAATGPGARVVVADSNGVAYVADSQGGRVLVVHPPKLK